ncbi:shikimate kinase [Desulfurobacterium atlanticum]|uniref:Shikimate kinase n=1 Tax=Desulfurobacterium atlanticum TaxID=240169 RepID=A0A238ZG28_9BACT|nr:shikimate kinase [Desulfurobacterium atlanticum]SNR81921.1 shikimate kinase [Desulfurobacterium atlanticum]
MRIALIGFMGCGKTTIGKLLAERLNYKFIDTDSEIEKKTGLTIPEIFKKHGEKFFREKEREVLIDILKEDNIVIATGGGLPAYKDNMEVLNENALTIYLDTDFETLWNRISKDKNRPLVKKGKESIQELYNLRKPFYKLSKIIVAQKENESPEKLAETILEKIKKTQRKI